MSLQPLPARGGLRRWGWGEGLYLPRGVQRPRLRGGRGPLSAPPLRGGGACVCPTRGGLGVCAPRGGRGRGVISLLAPAPTAPSLVSCRLFRRVVRSSFVFLQTATVIG